MTEKQKGHTVSLRQSKAKTFFFSGCSFDSGKHWPFWFWASPLTSSVAKSCIPQSTHRVPCWRTLIRSSVSQRHRWHQFTTNMLSNAIMKPQSTFKYGQGGKYIICWSMLFHCILLSYYIGSMVYENRISSSIFMAQYSMRRFYYYGQPTPTFSSSQPSNIATGDCC